MFCENCGENLEKKVKFCSTCGATVSHLFSESSTDTSDPLDFASTMSPPDSTDSSSYDASDDVSDAASNQASSSGSSYDPLDVGDTINNEDLSSHNDPGLNDSINDNDTMRPDDDESQSNTDRQPASERYRAKLTHSDGRVTFLIARNEIGFGKDKHSKNPDVDIPLRLLPCRSKELDPENWTNSLKIGHLHGVIKCTNNRMHLYQNSTNGMSFVQGQSGSETDSISDISGTITETNETPKKERLKKIQKGSWVPLPSACILSLGKKILRLEAHAIMDGEKISSFRLNRRSNSANHEYVQILTEATLGDHSSCAIRVKGCFDEFDLVNANNLISESVVALSFREGSFVLSKKTEKIRVQLNGSLMKDLECKLDTTAKIDVGPASFTFQYAQDKDFVDYSEPLKAKKEDSPPFMEASKAFILARKYEKGEGVRKSLTEALKYYRLSAEQGYALSQYSLGLLYEKGEGVGKSQEEAVKYYRLSAEQGCSIAQCKLADCYAEGKGVSLDCQKAAELYQRVTGKGIPSALYNLGRLHEDGKLEGSRPTEAVKLYRLSAEKGSALAMYRLGRCYEMGVGVQKRDIIKAIHWYRRAQGAGFGHASEAITRLSGGGGSSKRSPRVQRKAIDASVIASLARSEKKIGLIKELREVSGLSLKDSKEAIERHQLAKGYNLSGLFMEFQRYVSVRAPQTTSNTAMHGPSSNGSTALPQQNPLGSLVVRESGETTIFVGQKWRNLKTINTSFPIIKCIFTDRKKQTWFAGKGKKICIISSNSIKLLKSPFAKPISHIFEDSKDRIWMSSWGDGIACLENNKFTILQQPQGLCHNDVNGMAEDSKGGLWVATDKGVCVIDGNIFRNPLPNLPGINAKSITSDRNGRIIIGAIGGVIIVHPGGKTTMLTVDNGMPQKTAQAVFVDSRNRIWAGTWGGGVVQIDNKTFQVKKESALPQAALIRNIAEDSKGRILAASCSTGVWILDNDKWSSLSLPGNTKDLYLTTVLPADISFQLCKLSQQGEVSTHSDGKGSQHKPRTAKKSSSSDDSSSAHQQSAQYDSNARNSALAISNEGIRLCKSGEVEKGLPMLQKAVALDPYDNPALTRIRCELQKLNKDRLVSKALMGQIKAHAKTFRGWFVAALWVGVFIWLLQISSASFYAKRCAVVIAPILFIEAYSNYYSLLILTTHKRVIQLVSILLCVSSWFFVPSVARMTFAQILLELGVGSIPLLYMSLNSCFRERGRLQDSGLIPIMTTFVLLLGSRMFLFHTFWTSILLLQGLSYGLFFYLREKRLKRKKLSSPHKSSLGLPFSLAIAISLVITLLFGEVLVDRVAEAPVFNKIITAYRSQLLRMG